MGGVLSPNRRFNASSHSMKMSGIQTRGGTRVAGDKKHDAYLHYWVVSSMWKGTMERPPTTLMQNSDISMCSRKTLIEPSGIKRVPTTLPNSQETRNKKNMRKTQLPENPEERQ